MQATQENKFKYGNPEDMPHVLIVDDDDRIRQLVSRFLREQGFIVNTAAGAKEARAALQRLSFDALVVDVMMPGESGLDLTASIKADQDVPVLMLTALGEAEDRIAGLEKGADDYLAKPFEPRELVLRLQSILRRRPQAKQHRQEEFKVGPWLYNEEYNELQDGQKIQRLTAVEGNLLRALASRAGTPVSREELASLCEMDSGERTIDVQVTRLRRKIEPDMKAPRYLQTVRGKGYLLRINS